MFRHFGFIAPKTLNYLDFQSFDFGYPIYMPFGFIAPKTLNNLAFQSFDFDPTL